MGLNQNHIVEELGGTRCAIVEKNITQERADFLTTLLCGNGYMVVCAEAAPPKAKASAAKPAAEGEVAEALPEIQEAPKGNPLLTLGVTDVLFNTTNALYGRILTNAAGRIVTPDYWFQKDPISQDEVPYFAKTK